MSDRTTRLVVAGVSVRAFAESAARAGYEVIGVDAFGDLDLRRIAAVMPLGSNSGQRYSASAAARVAAAVPAELAAYVSNFENYPLAVRRLGAGRLLLGNPPDVLARVRQPLVLAWALRRAGFAVPRARASVPLNGGRWLLKPRRSGGGHGTRVWRRGRTVGRGQYLQEWIDGTPGSVVFVADGRCAHPLGVSRQLVGERRFGATGFRYCGSLIAPAAAELFGRDAEVRATALALATTVTREFGLVGLNGIDFVARDGVPYPIEVNPRYSASMELVERASGASLAALHVAASTGRLPRRWPRLEPRSVYGKAILFAPRSVRVGDTRRWLANDDVRDVPAPGEWIARGRPICTVFARGATVRGCLARLERRADAVYRVLERAGRRAA